MRYSRIGVSALLAGLAAALSAGGTMAVDYSEVAPVIASTPIVERVNTPTHHCWNETVITQESSSYSNSSPGYGGAIVGGILGGVLGHQIGSGRGRDLATAGGAVAGALAGSNIENRNRTAYAAPVEQTVQRCETVDNYRDEIRGYDVVYRYNGHNVHTRLPYNPGSTVRVNVGMAQ